MLHDANFLDATALAGMVRTGQCTPSELVDASIARIEQLNPRLNAVIHKLYDKARAAARSSDLPDGPFRGVPFLMKDVVARTAQLLQTLGHEVEIAAPPLGEQPPSVLALFGIVIARELDRWSVRTGDTITAADVEPWNWTLAEMGRSITAPQCIAIIEELQGFARRVAAWWEDGFDVLVTPTLPQPPPLLGSMDKIDMPAFGAFTVPFNITGQPAISLPMHWNEAGLPIGVQCVAAYGREDILIRLAAQLEAAQPWSHRRAPV